MLHRALEYLLIGFNVIPARGKIPAVAWQQYQNRKITREELRKMWFPEANIAVITGTISNIAVLDIDNPEAVEKIKTKGLPRTAVVKTRRGFHYYFRVNGMKIKSGRLLPGVDIKAEGGIVIVPPSRHPEGGRYTWYQGMSPFTTPLADLPQWVAEHTEPATEPIKQISQGVRQGQRNVSLAKLTGAWLKYGFTYEETLALALRWNQLNEPPLPEQEVVRTVQSIYRKEETSRQKVKELIEYVSDLIIRDNQTKKLLCELNGLNAHLLGRVDLLSVLNAVREKEKKDATTAGN